MCVSWWNDDIQSHKYSKNHTPAACGPLMKANSLLLYCIFNGVDYTNYSIWKNSDCCKLAFCCRDVLPQCSEKQHQISVWYAVKFMHVWREFYIFIVLLMVCFYSSLHQNDSLLWFDFWDKFNKNSYFISSDDICKHEMVSADCFVSL